MNLLWIRFLEICFIVRTFCVSGDILAPKKVIRNVGEDIEFLLNSTGNKPIGASKIRLKDPDTKLMTVIQQNGKLKLDYSDDLDSAAGRRFIERVLFIGNLAVGHVWFRITKATIGDSNTFIVSVKKLDDDDYKHYEVQLLVNNKKGAIATITCPDLLTGVVGQDIDFKINTSSPMLAMKFGIDNKDELPSPLFITFTTLHDGVQCSGDLNTTAAARYKGRVDFVGNITKGHAWIQITNLTKDDSMVYRISVREEQSDYYVSKTIKLLVKDKEAAPTAPTTESKQKPTPPHKSTVKLTTSSTLRPSSPTSLNRSRAATSSMSQPHSPTIPGRFRYFEGRAEKIIINEKRFQLEKEKRKFAIAVENVYRASYRILYLSDLKITVSNMTVKVNFFMTFKQTVSLDSAFTILKDAPKKNQLQGYNITCLTITDKPPTVKSKSRSQSSQTWLHVTLAIFGAVFLFIVIVAIVCVCYKRQIREYMKNCCLSNGADRNNDIQLVNR